MYRNRPGFNAVPGRVNRVFADHETFHTVIKDEDRKRRK